MVCGNGLACKHKIDCCAQIFSGDRDAVAGAAVIVLAAIDELEIRVKVVGIGRARGFVSVRYGLRLVVEVGKFKAVGLGLLLEAGRTVGRVRAYIIRTDGDKAERFSVVIGAELAKG